jgi:undecaprenyl-phosphate 4-deoxy-4-formamido-L-arabinose transferase
MNLSIVIPIYNSSQILNELINQLNSNINSKIVKKFEIILVNDCSKDNSWEIIKEIEKNNPKVKGINLLKNYGQHSAIFAGLKFAKGKKIITMDDDLQHPPSGIMDIYNKLDACDLCYTIYLNRNHPKWKKVISYLNNVYSTFLLNKPLNIYHSSFRGFKFNLCKKILLFRKPVIFLDSLLLNETKNICTIKVKHKKRLVGESNYKINNLFSLFFDMIVNYHFLPIRFGTLLGFVSKFIVVILRLFTSRKKIQYEIKEKTF